VADEAKERLKKLKAAIRMAKRLRDSLRGREHSDSGELQREDRER
jgi:hypothetical protein